MSYVRFIERPKLLDPWVRVAPNGEHEEAAIISVCGSNENWKAKLISVYFGSVEVMPNGMFDANSFRPKDWVLYEAVGAYAPKGRIVSPTRHCVLPVEKMETADIPVPEPEEAKAAWGKRVFDEIGEIFAKWDGAKVLMERVWKLHREPVK